MCVFVCPRVKRILLTQSDGLVWLIGNSVDHENWPAKNEIVYRGIPSRSPVSPRTQTWTRQWHDYTTHLQLECVQTLNVGLPRHLISGMMNRNNPDANKTRADSERTITNVAHVCIPINVGTWRWIPQSGECFIHWKMCSLLPRCECHSRLWLRKLDFFYPRAIFVLLLPRGR